jgi:hypothetical protein
MVGCLGKLEAATTSDASKIGRLTKSRPPITAGATVENRRCGLLYSVFGI